MFFFILEYNDMKSELHEFLKTFAGEGKVRFLLIFFFLLYFNLFWFFQNISLLQCNISHFLANLASNVLHQVPHFYPSGSHQRRYRRFLCWNESEKTKKIGRWCEFALPLQITSMFILKMNLSKISCNLCLGYELHPSLAFDFKPC